MDSLPAFQLHKPATVSAALAVWRGDPSARFLAGGTDLIVNMRRGIVDTGTLIDLTGIAELKRLASDVNGLTIGAAVTLDNLFTDTRIERMWPLLARAVATIAGPTHRKAATVGGNLCLDTRCIYYNQSEWWRRSNDYCLKHRGEICHVAPSGSLCLAAYSGDLAPALIALEAEATIAGPHEYRTIALEQMFADDGANHLLLAESELLVNVHVPCADDLRTGYDKVRVRDAIDFPLVGVAVALKRERDTLTRLRVALTGTNPRPILIDGCEALIGAPLDEAALGKLDKLIRKQIKPMRSTFTAGHYRRRVASNVAKRLVRKLYR